VGEYLIKVTGYIENTSLSSPHEHEESFILTVLADPDACINSALPLTVSPLTISSIEYIVMTAGSQTELE